MDKFLRVALDAAKKSEKVIMKYYSPKTRATLKADQTPVTIADKMAEKIIIQTIKKKFPTHSFLGEEWGQKNGKSSEYEWIIDPIDGTKNYIRQIPFFGTQIALMKDGEIIAGVSNACAMGELMYASKGNGAYLNGKRVHVSKVSNFPEAFVCYGNLKFFDKHKCLNPLLRLARECRYTREYGDCWMYHLVAQGKIEMALEAENKIWDVAASKIIIEEAGGKFTEFSGKKLTKNSVSGIGTNGILHNKVIGYFNK